MGVRGVVAKLAQGGRGEREGDVEKRMKATDGLPTWKGYYVGAMIDCEEGRGIVCGSVW
jgi:hypothetical protein